MNAVLIGATGLIGNELLNSLLEDNRYNKVIALTRKPLQPHAKLENHLIKFDVMEEYSKLCVGDHFYCALGTTIKQAGSKEYFYRVDYSYVYEFAKIAKQHLAERFLIVSSQGANAASSIFYPKVKGEIEAAIKELGLVSTSIFRPSLLLGNRKEYRSGEEFGKKMMSVISFLIPLKYKPIHASVVASAMINAAFNQAEKNKIYESDEIQELGKA
ncbi:MAG: oxidoreductase [Ignavibacteria bacterium]|nr:oxidoreductase [Ignavibacteria bacterium]